MVLPSTYFGRDRPNATLIFFAPSQKHLSRRLATSLAYAHRRRRQPIRRSAQFGHYGRRLAIEHRLRCVSPFCETSYRKLAAGLYCPPSTAVERQIVTSPRVDVHSFAGVRTVVDTSIMFDEVLGRLKGAMGNASIPDIIAIASSVHTEDEYVRGNQTLCRSKWIYVVCGD
jgi:hypothetical protein